MIIKSRVIYFFCAIIIIGCEAMDLLQPYVGKHCTAKSASNDIDIDAILAACDEIDSSISELGTIAGNVSSTSSYFGVDSLSVDGATMLDSVDTCSQSINTSQSDVLNMTSSIRQAAVERYNQIQQQYNDSAKATDERIESYG